MRFLTALLLIIPATLPAQSLLPGSLLGGPRPSMVLLHPPSMAGPRVGLIYFANGITRHDDNDSRRPSSNLMTIFGWQIEDESFRLENGLTGMTEIVVSVAGIDQHLFLPAASLLLALRTHKGIEAGLGPTISPTELSLTLAAGRSFQAGSVRFPLNAAVVLSATGPRISLTTGWIVER
jgi:hypothetical protein